MSATTAPVEGPKIFNLEDISTWKDRPLNSKSLPEEFQGKTYAWLVHDEKGRHYLVGRLYATQDGKRDLCAAKILKSFPHGEGCKCTPCNNEQAYYKAGSPEPTKLGENDKLAPAPPVEVVAVDEQHSNIDETEAFDSSTPLAVDTTLERVEAPESPVTAVAQVNPASVPPAKPVAPDLKTDKKLKLAKKSEAGVARAEADLEATKKALEIELPLEKLFREAEEATDRVFVEEAKKSNDAFSASAAAWRAREDIVNKLVNTIDINNGWAAAWAAKQIKAAEDELDRVKREAAALVERAEKADNLREKVLLPKLKTYAEGVPVEQRATEKTIRLPGWPGRLTFVDRGTSVEITSTPVAISAIKEAVGGEDKAVELGLLKIQLVPSESALADYYDQTKKTIAGVKVTPAGDRLTIYRR